MGIQSQFKVVNPVHETFHNDTTLQGCLDWLDSFASAMKQDVQSTGPGTYRVGQFNLYIFENGSNQDAKT